VSPRPSISGRAEADLTNQYRWYFENAGEEVAERFLAAFDTTLARLARVPELGRRRRFRNSELAGLRSFGVSGPFAAHLIFYRVTDQSLSVERVMHGARDLPPAFRDARGLPARDRPPVLILTPGPAWKLAMQDPLRTPFLQFPDLVVRIVVMSRG
jgi:toxin ParE1/3/4